MNLGKRKYSPEYKAQAIALAVRMGNVSEAARKLGVPTHTLFEWLRQKEGKAEPTHELSAEEKIRQLERENEELKKANFILKQAAAFFSQDHLK